MVAPEPVSIDLSPHPEGPVKPIFIAAGVAGVAMAIGGLALGDADWLIWNRTGSAPIGLYEITGRPYARGAWVSVSRESAEARWAQERGYVGENWPLIKQIAALPGAEICRENLDILIDGAPVATALQRDFEGRDMPEWQGCIPLQPGEIFLLNDHPRSLDGRYLGATRLEDVDGVAVPVFTLSD